MESPHSPSSYKLLPSPATKITRPTSVLPKAIQTHLNPNAFMTEDVASFTVTVVNSGHLAQNHGQEVDGDVLRMCSSSMEGLQMSFKARSVGTLTHADCR